MTITRENPDDDAPVTTLCGQLLDQAALAGALNHLYGLHLLLAECVAIGQFNHTCSQFSIAHPVDLLPK